MITAQLPVVGLSDLSCPLTDEGGRVESEFSSSSRVAAAVAQMHSATSFLPQPGEAIVFDLDYVALTWR